VTLLQPFACLSVAAHRTLFRPCDARLLDAPVRVGLRCLAMPGLLLRKTATLVVAYSIALQVLLVGFAVGAHAGSPFAVICESNSTDDHNTPPQKDRRDCSACPLACGDGSSGVVPLGATLSFVLFAKEVRLSAVKFETLPAPAKHQLQASRAPPIAG
jgi:hypothetical protein